MSFDQPTDEPDFREITDGRNEQRDRMLNEGDERKTATEADVERCLHWMSSNVAKLAQAIANRQHLEHFLKVVEARAKAALATEPAHRQETLARSGEAYLTTLDGFKAAVEEEQRLRYGWQLCDTVVQVWRTKEASNRKGGL